MRFLFFILLFFSVALTANAQLPKKLKYDELIYSYDSSTVLIRKGSLSSVYDLKENKYLIDPTKNCIINFQLSNLYAEIDEKTGILSIHFFAGRSYEHFLGTVDSCSIATREGESSRMYEIIKCNNGNYILNNYYDGEMMTYQSHIDEKTGVTVKDGLYRDVQLTSGVYNVELKKWIIEPNYKRCYELNGYVFCLNEKYLRQIFADEFYHPNPYFYSYDLFQLNGDSAGMILDNAKIIETDLIGDILNCDTILQCEDPNHYIIGTNDKKGLVRFQLFDSENSEKPDFIYSVVMEPTADYIMYSPFYHMVVAMFSDSLKPLVIYDYYRDSIQINQTKNELKWRASDSVEVGMKFIFDYNYGYDSSVIILTKKQQFQFELDSLGLPVLVASERSEWADSYFGIELQKNGLLVINNWCPIYSNPTNPPLRSVIYPDEDSIYIDFGTGEYLAVYPPDFPGFLQSGVYDPKNNKWIIEPKYNIINPNERYYFLQTGYVENDTEEIYSIVDSVGNLIEHSLTLEKILTDVSLLKYALPYPSDSLTEASLGFSQHTKFEQKDPGYYVISGELLGLYKPSVALNNLWPTGLYEFIHHNPDLNFTYYLEGDSIYFKSPQMNISVSKKNGKIIFVQPLYYTEPLSNFELYKIENADTIFYGEKTLIDGPVTRSSISMKGDLLIINDHTSTVDNSCIECFDSNGDFFSSELHFGSESSSAWKKTENGWRKISPDYATLAPIKNGRYVASSGYYYEQSDISGKWLETDIPGRYFLLDSNFNAISYLDYFDFPLIEDLGFGLKICLDNAKCFFMTYNLVAVTDAEWDDFELFGKKLKAIQYEVPMIDEYGEQMYDENGAPIMISESVTMFFAIP